MKPNPNPILDKEKIVRDMPFDGAWRVDFLLSDDTTASITFCEGCLDVLDRNLKKIWQICLERFRYEEEKRGISPQGDAQLDYLKEQHLVREQGRTRWSELKGDII